MKKSEKIIAVLTIIVIILLFILFGVCLMMATNMYFHLLITPLLLLVCVLSVSSIYLINKK